MYVTCSPVTNYQLLWIVVDSVYPFAVTHFIHCHLQLDIFFLKKKNMCMTIKSDSMAYHRTLKDSNRFRFWTSSESVFILIYFYSLIVSFVNGEWFPNHFEMKIFWFSSLLFKINWLADRRGSNDPIWAERRIKSSRDHEMEMQL